MAEGDEEVTRVLERGKEVRFYGARGVLGGGWRMISFGGEVREGGWLVFYYLWEGGELFVFVGVRILSISTHHHER